MSSTCEFDLRVGGALQVDTQGPDGAIMPMTGTFVVVDEPSKLVMTNSPLGPDGGTLFEIQHTVELTEENGQTRLDITSEVISAGPNAEMFLSGMKPVLEQAFEQLSEILSAK